MLSGFSDRSLSRGAERGYPRRAGERRQFMDDRNGVLRGIATRPAKRAAMVIHSTATIDGGAGLAGDFRRTPKRQVTLLAWEKWLAACADLGVAADQVPATLPWTFRRAN